MLVSFTHSGKTIIYANRHLCVSVFVSYSPLKIKNNRRWSVRFFSMGRTNKQEFNLRNLYNLRLNWAPLTMPKDVEFTSLSEESEKQGKKL